MEGSARRGLPPPAPPAERTAGQLVGESLRLYGRRFWRSLALGLGPVAFAVGVSALPSPEDLIFAATAGAVVLTLSYIGACLLAQPTQRTRRSLATALAVGTLVFVPVPFLARILVLPAVAWLALFGLAVPVAVYEARGLRESLGRAVALARADFIHALGSLATLAIVGFVSAIALASLLVQFGDQARSTAALLPLLLVSPVLLLGAAQLYFDQAARVPPEAVRRGLTSPRPRGGK
jgi:hypothetical protein